MSLKTSYCYWSVATGDEGALMEACVRSAREAGVFKEFHVLTDRPLAGCECYDAFACDRSEGLFKLHYLKEGMSRLNFDCFVWIDAPTRFLRNPLDVLGTLGKSPVHVPLEVNLTRLGENREWNGVSTFRLRDELQAQGIVDDAWLSGSAFWIVHHDAIEAVYDLALGFWHQAKKNGLITDVSAALGFAMQMLCADPERHRIEDQLDLWLPDYALDRRDARFASGSWDWRHPLRTDLLPAWPAIVGLGNGARVERLTAITQEPAF